MAHTARIQFELKFCRNVLKGQKDIVISPYSAGVCTAMVLSASDNDTRNEMCQAMDIDPECEEPFMRQHKETSEYLNQEHEGLQLVVSNSLWANFRVEDAYKKSCVDYFKAEVLQLTNKTTINEWVSNQTKGKISDLIKEDPEGPAVLVNAVFFNGVFEHSFLEENTKDRVFYPDYKENSPGDSVMVTTMQKVQKMLYLEHKAGQIVELPYGNGSFSLLIILPSPALGTTGALDILMGEEWKELRDCMYNELLHLEVPKCSLEYDLSLIPTMETMGIKEVFSPSKASLGRLMKGLPGAYIKAMMQAATFDLFEKGVTAAAATAAVAGTRGGGGRRAIDPTKMKVDRPHLMFIVENKLDVLLFAAVVNNPKVKVIN